MRVFVCVFHHIRVAFYCNFKFIIYIQYIYILYKKRAKIIKFHGKSMDKNSFV